MKKTIMKNNIVGYGVIALAIAVGISLIGFGVVKAFDSGFKNEFTGPVTIYQGQDGVNSFGTATDYASGFTDINVTGTAYIAAMEQTGSGTFSGTNSFTGANTFTSTLTASTFTQGGGIKTTSTTATTGTLAAADFDTENVIAFTANTADVTLTLPASSTLSSFIPTAGQTRTIFIRNATTTATIDITIAGGTGTILKVASSSPSAAIITGDTDGDNYGRITFIRKTNTDIDALLDIYKD